MRYLSGTTNRTGLLGRPILRSLPWPPSWPGGNARPIRPGRLFRQLNWAVSGPAAAAVGVDVRQRRPAPTAIAAATMLVNVAVPRVPAAVRAGGYAPGVVTAVTLVLPIMSRHLLNSYR